MSINGLVTKTLKLHTKGITVITNNKNADMSTTGTGEPYHLLPLTPECKAFVPSNFSVDDRDTILGFKTLHVRVPQGNVTAESWYAPELGCQEIKRIATRADGAQEKFAAIEASTMPPADEVFEIPTNKVERKPSDFWNALTPLPADHTNDAHDAQHLYNEQLDIRYERDRLARERRAQN